MLPLSCIYFSATKREGLAHRTASIIRRKNFCEIYARAVSKSSGGNVEFLSSPNERREWRTLESPSTSMIENLNNK
jgi:hypothetical protein